MAAPQTLFVGTPLVVMVSERPEVERAAGVLWQLGNRLPASLPRLGRAGVVAFAVGTSAMVAMAWVRRATLRALLSYQGWLYEGPKDKNLTTLVWGFLVKIVSGQHPLRIGAPNPRLYSNQGALPRLPVPKLEETCRRFLLSVRPVLADEDYQAFTRLVADFQRKEGPKLQRYLTLKSWFTPNYVRRTRAHAWAPPPPCSPPLRRGHGSQVTDWWEKYVYLRGRSPIIINSNYYVLDSKNPVVRSLRWRVHGCVGWVHQVLTLVARVSVLVLVLLSLSLSLCPMGARVHRRRRGCRRRVRRTCAVRCSSTSSCWTRRRSSR
jgi:hypothetical protein